jgi:hypothetical protein
MKNFISMAISACLAIAIVGGGIYLMSTSTEGTAVKVPVPENVSVSTRVNNRDTYPAQPMSPSVNAGSTITKCIVNGKTTYSDQPCAPGIRSQTVELHDSSGVVSPNAATVQAARQRIQAEMATEVIAVSTVSTGKQGDPFACAALSTEINSIDAATRNRLDAYEMQGLRIRREEVRTQQFRLGC